MLPLEQTGRSEHMLPVDEHRNVLRNERAKAASNFQRGFKDCDWLLGGFKDAARRDEARRGTKVPAGVAKRRPCRGESKP